MKCTSVMRRFFVLAVVLGSLSIISSGCFGPDYSNEDGSVVDGTGDGVYAPDFEDGSEGEDIADVGSVDAEPVVHDSDWVVDDLGDDRSEGEESTDQGEPEPEDRTEPEDSETGQQRPVALDVVVETHEETPIDISLSAFSQSGGELTYDITTAPVNGVLTGTAPNLWYQPTADFSGADSFQYVASDGQVESNVATVSITVEEGTIWYVVESGEEWRMEGFSAVLFTSIQDAVDAADDDGNDIVQLFDGTWSENVTITKDLLLMGFGDDRTFVTGTDVEQPIFTVEEGVSVYMASLTVEDGTAQYGAGIWNAGILTLEEILIRNNHATHTGGGLHNTGDLSMTSSEIVDNTSVSLGAGIFSTGDNLMLERVTFTTNHTDYYGGALNTFAAYTTVNDCMFTGNSSAFGGPGIYGGFGELVITDSTFAGNRANRGDGGAVLWNGEGERVFIESTEIIGNHANDGAGLSIMNAELTISNSNIIGNMGSLVSGRGGGIQFGNGIIQLTNVTISQNEALSGGGISLAFASGTIDSTTISDNLAPISGGGVAIGLCDPESLIELVFVNSTISGNTAGSGAAIRHLSGHVTLVNVTVADNIGEEYGAIDTNGGDYGSFVVSNTILSFNEPRNCYFNSNEMVTSDGFNISTDDSCELIESGDLEMTDPMLGELADNGGLTQTHTLLPGSPAIDAGQADLTLIDQRGSDRPIDGDGDGIARPDIGALEIAAP